MRVSIPFLPHVRVGLLAVVLSCLALPMSRAEPARTLYDPLALAVEALDSMGLPVPAGYTVQEVPAGSMGEGRIATVDYDTLTISVDVAAFGEMAGFPPGGLCHLTHGDAPA